MTETESRDSTVTLTEHDYSPILDELQALGRSGVANYEVFQDFVDVVITMLSPEETDPAEIYEKYEDLSSGSIDAREHFGNAVQAMLEAYNEVNHDVIGKVYEELDIQNESIGQYFTPSDVTNLMARCLNKSDSDANTVVTESRDNERDVIHDPTCGTGRMLIDAVLESDDDDEIAVTGVDKSAIAAKMATINFAVMNTEARIWHGDSLTMDMHQRWTIAPTPMQLGLIYHESIDSIK
jgi:type I restriction-modification system DNA methylase subunit